jgi:menaquinol-cytochrome c reductase iron-sulfur subunit
MQYWRSLHPENKSMKDQTRRRFYSSFVYGAGTLISAALAIPAALYLLFPNKSKKSSAWVDAGNVSQLEQNVPVELSFQQTITDGWSTSVQKKTAWVVNLPGSGIVAFTPQCTHLGCAYHWDEKTLQFLCPCHNSIFSLDGKVVAGPAPRPLDRYQSKVEKNKLLLGPVKESA